MRRWFLPRTPDVLALLRGQADVTVTGMRAFAAWSSGDASRLTELRDAEHEADRRRRELLVEVRSAFSLPVDGEDLYLLSERLDDVLDSAKDAAREAELIGLEPDAPMAAMAAIIVAGLEHVVRGIATLVSDPDAATAAADLAITAARHVEKEYRVAMSSLLAIEDMRELMGRRELYRRYSRIAGRITSVAERVWYSVVKER